MQLNSKETWEYFDDETYAMQEPIGSEPESDSDFEYEGGKSKKGKGKKSSSKSKMVRTHSFLNISLPTLIFTYCFKQ